ncbi:GIY-YIG nuclease family protein [Cytobacillus firmus]|uniref:GIY-YIG nuclease family protein n=1 Tax=Cytobacillus firmus TaxID=1399 RepID=UPI0018CD6F94|nr:GIY-YIG nuclease family protein [Cytobacillus firmus]
MSEKEYLYHDSNITEEEFFSYDAKELKQFFGKDTIARNMKFLLEGNKTQKLQVMKNIRYWVKFRCTNEYVSITLPFLIASLEFEDYSIRLDAAKTIKHIAREYRLSFDDWTENLIRININKIPENENANKEIDRLMNPFWKRLYSTNIYGQIDFAENEKEVREHPKFKSGIPKQFQFRQKKKSSLKQYNGGCVYLIREMEQGRIKIGKSKSIENRLKHFGIALPFRIEEVYFIATRNYDELEQVLHKKYAHKRVNGEWFDLNDKDIQEIKRIKSDSDWISSEQLSLF